jgi:geranylgeranyl reductase family protein
MKRGVDRQVDLLVVGAGPAGSMAALGAAQAGLETLMVERRAAVGRPVRCGEYVPLALAQELPTGVELPVRALADALHLHLLQGETREIRSPGAVIDRAAFDQSLADAAQAAGARLLGGTPLVALERGGIATLGGASSGRVRARLIIGADGPRSLVAAAAGLGHPRVMLGLQREVGLSRPVDGAHLYLWATARYGYGWLFPKGSTANLGVAVPRGAGRLGRRALSELTLRLADEELLSEAGAARRGEGDPGRSGLVPCGGVLPRLAAGRVLLAGDAAGHTDPLTGAGIAAAVRAGALVGSVAALALGEGRWTEAGPRYELEWRRVFGRSAARSLDRRHELEALWDRDLRRALRRAWVV